MEIIATPWRMAYIEGASGSDDCAFCKLLAAPGSDAERAIVHRGEQAFLVMNIYPYTPGHLLAVPYQHAASPGALPPGAHAELLSLCRLGELLLRRAFSCRSVHVGANLGRLAGAGVPDHVHYHIVAWPDGEVWDRCCAALMMPESIADTRARLASLLPELLGREVQAPPSGSA